MSVGASIQCINSREDVLYGFMQFVVKDIIDGQTTLLDNALRMLCQLLTTWKNNADKVI